ncbi:MAG: hypothetical protein ACAH20_09040 [Methylobacteriaceae bacterium]
MDDLLSSLSEGAQRAVKNYIAADPDSPPPERAVSTIVEFWARKHGYLDGADAESAGSDGVDAPISSLTQGAQRAVKNALASNPRLETPPQAVSMMVELWAHSHGFLDEAHAEGADALEVAASDG